jgi:hypothetical protein
VASYRDVVAQCGSGGLVGFWWLSIGMWWLSEVLVAKWDFGGLVY